MMEASNIRKIFVILLSLIGISTTFAQENISLNGSWQFWIPENAEVAYHLKQKQTVTVPHTYNIMDGLEDYAGKACYSRELPITESMKGQQIRVHFNAVYHDAVVYVNGKKVGEHMNAGYTPFSFDITPFVTFGAKNEIMVECDNSYSENNFPWKRKFDWANDGGIYRNVSLHLAGKQSLRYVHVTPNINLADSTAIAHFDIRLFEPDVKKTVAEITIIENKTGRQIYSGKHNLKLEKDGTFKCNINCGNVLLWHFDDPNLYTMDVKIWNGKQLSDEKKERFGFRKFVVEGDHFLFNGEKVRLPGVEDMPGSNPIYGMAEPECYMEKTVRLMKDLNCTLTRFHWAQDDYRWQMMDSIGMMAQEEISWWQGPWNRLTDEQMEVAKRQLSEMVEAHYNHPSIWAWGMSNEVGDNREDIKIMAEYTRKLDQTRIIDAVCNKLWRVKENDPSLVLDLPTWNEYVGTWHAQHRNQLPGFFKEIEPVLNGRPLLITEHGLCEPAFTGGDARRVDEMIYHISEWKKHPYVAGYIYFCVQDYRTQMGEEGSGRDRIRRHGVTTKELTPKASYYILQQIMNPIDIILVNPANSNKNEGTLANLYEVDANNHDAEITIKVKNDIPSYTLRGYRVEYKDANGKAQKLELPALSPGNEHKFVLKNVNKCYNFNVVRHNSIPCLKY